MLGPDGRDTLGEAIAAHKPAHVFALVSGGHDSAAMLHYVKDRIDAAVHIDTGTGIPETREYVEALCALWGVRLLTYAAVDNVNKDGEPDPQIYADIVRQHGFPGPFSHRYMYARLKERPLRMLMRAHPGVKLLVTGVRSSESTRRMGHVQPIKVETRNKVWVAPCHTWDAARQAAYMAAHQIPRNRVKDCLGMSGECLCGAFAKKGELDRIRAFAPAVAARIDALEQEIRYIHPWGWEDRPPRLRAPPRDDMEPSETPVLCTGCESSL